MKRYLGIGLGLCAALIASPVPLHADPSAPAASDAPITLLMDITSGQVLHSHEADRRFLPASVTKVMTAWLAFEMLADGRLKQQQTFTVSDRLFTEWSGTGSTMFLQRGEEVSVDQLLHGITAVSANDGSVLLAEGAAGSVERWISLMNEEAAKLGMDNSHFGTPNGWPDEGKTFTTARDLAKLAKAITERHPQFYTRYFGKPGYSHNGFTQRNHDPITGKIIGADGIKTGFTREAGFNFLGSAERNGRRLVVIVAGTASDTERGNIAREYVEWGFTAFEPQVIFPAGSSPGSVRVQGGATRNVNLRVSGPIIVDMPRGEQRQIKVAMRYRGPIRAPIAAGNKVAELEVSVEGFETFNVPLEAAENVSKANAWQRIVNSVLGFLT